MRQATPPPLCEGMKIMRSTTVWPSDSDHALAPAAIGIPREMLDLIKGLVPRHMRLREEAAGQATVEPPPPAPPIEPPHMENPDEWVDRLTPELRRRIIEAE